MIWKMNTIDSEHLMKVANNLKGDFIIDRLCYNLGYKKDTLLQYIDEENARILLATLLINRELDKYTDIINAPQNFLIDPTKLTNAQKAANLINKYVRNRNAYVYVFADYDVDGLTAGYTMTSALREVSTCQSVSVKFPDREEGYGLNLQWCKKIVEQHTDEETGKVLDDVLVITVDNGITKVSEVEYLKQNNIEVVITDHHPSKDVVPNCIVVDPHNNTIEQDDTFKHLCGCGVAFKVAQLVQELNGVNNMYNYFPFLALSTISDVMPMHTENLAFLQYGLDIMNSKDCPLGIAELKRQESIDIVTTTTIGWTIAPMLNACGRMGDIELASKLFFTDNEPVQDIVSKIKSVNDKRKSITKRATNELLKTPNIDTDKVFIMNTTKYPGGVLGIIAGKATEIFNKPSIIVTPVDKEKKYLHGSARSANNIDLIPLMKVLKEEGLIIEYGGHAEAVGIQFSADKIDAIQNRLNELIVYVPLTEEQILETISTEEVLEIDEILSLENLNVVMLALSNMLPTDGKQIKNPVFAVTDCEVKAFKVYPSGYMEITLKQGNKVIDMSAMGYAETFSTQILPQLDGKDKKLVHVAGTISKHFKTKKYVLNIVDIVAA